MRKTAFSITLLALLFVGCGSDSKKSSTEEPTVENPVSNKPEDNLTKPVEENLTEEDNKTVEPKNLSIPLCEEGSFPLQSGDRVLKISENPEVEIVHSASGKKSICLKSGEAEVERR